MPENNRDTWELIEYLNSLFDYGEQEQDLEFWTNMLDSQVDEIRQHLENGKIEKAHAEFADAIFVSQQALIKTADDHDKVVRGRAWDVIGRVDSIQPNYEETDGVKATGSKDQ